MAKIAGVYILDIPYHADKAYSYYIPSTIEETVEVGCVVDVPFGKGNRRTTGIVAEICEGETDARTKPIIGAAGDRAILTEELLRLCLFVKDYTLCTFGEALRAIIPPASMSRVMASYRVVPEEERENPVSYREAIKKLGERGQRVFEICKIKQKFSRQAIQSEVDFNVTKIISLMLELGLIEQSVEIKSSLARSRRSSLIYLFGLVP